MNEGKELNHYNQIQSTPPPIGPAAHGRFKDMRRGFETNFCHKKKSSPPTPEGREAKAYMRNGFTAGFCHFLGT